MRCDWGHSDHTPALGKARDAGRISVPSTELVGAIAQMFVDPDAENSRRVVLDLADGLIVRGLDGPLAQVFRNIIENAVSFSPKEGEIRVAA